MFIPALLARISNTIIVFSEDDSTFGTTPFQILGKKDGSSTALKMVNRTGLGQLEQVLELFGILSAAIIIVCALGTLVIVNYPKTVAQTKEKIANAFMTIAFIAAFPLIADVIYTVIVNAFY